MLIAVASQVDPPPPEATQLDAQHRRIQQAIAFMEANFTLRMTAMRSHASLV